MRLLWLNSYTAPSVVPGVLQIATQPTSATVTASELASFSVLAAGAVGQTRFQWQVLNQTNGTWFNFADSDQDPSPPSLNHTATFYAGVPAGQVRSIRVVVSTPSQPQVISQTVTLTVSTPTTTPPTQPPGNGTPSSRFWNMADFPYPPAPTVGTTVAGALVVEVSNRSQLNAAIANNRYIILNDGNYQDAARLNIDSRTNLTLHARNKHGARFEFSAYNQNNCIHATRNNGITFRGLLFKRPQFYGIRFGSSASFPGNPQGANRNVLVEHCRFTDTAAGQLKIDNGDTSAAGITENVEVRYCNFDSPGQSPSAGPSFCEGIYMGSGDSLCHVNRVRDVNIHHNIFDGSAMGADGSGEAVEAKVYCSDIRIADNVFIQWKTGQDTSGGAIAISVNTGSNLTGGIVPSAGTRGMLSYLVERNRIYGTRTSASWAAGNAIVIGHGNCTVRNNVIWGSTHAAFRIMQKNSAANGVFSNPNELDVNVLHNTCVANGSVWSVDFLSPPNNARFSSRNNAFSGGSSYPTNGVTWTAQQDIWNMSTTAVASGSFTGTQETPAGSGIGYGLRPVSDSVLVTTTDAGVTEDALGQSRPSGARQAGAIEARIA